MYVCMYVYMIIVNLHSFNFIVQVISYLAEKEIEDEKKLKKSKERQKGTV